MHGELNTGKHNRVAPKECDKDCLKQSLAFVTDYREWSTLTAGLVPYRHDVVSAFEMSRSASLEDKHQGRNNNADVASNPGQPYFCHHYNRI